MLRLKLQHEITDFWTDYNKDEETIYKNPDGSYWVADSDMTYPVLEWEGDIDSVARPAYESCTEPFEVAIGTLKD